MSDFFATYELDPIGEILNTGFHRFTTASSLQGLAKVDGNSLEVLAVVATEQHKGHFRDFIAAAKLRFDKIVVLDVWTPFLEDCLLRYGFRKTPVKHGCINYEWTQERKEKHEAEKTEGDQVVLCAMP